jgi:circadian clock protein KaiC
MSRKDSLGPTPPPVAPTGVDGLDAILQGGLPREEMHLLQGVAGTGKTTIALQFLYHGVRAGERVLYITLSQSKQHLERIARSHGWTLDGMDVYELSPGTVADRISGRQTILSTADVELGELFREVADTIERVKPRRAVVDSITIIQMLAGSAHRYHQEVVTLRQMFVENGCTLIALADHPAEREHGDGPEVIFHPLSGCVVQLHQQARPFGNARRRLRVVKARGIPHNSGYHDMVIRTGHTDVYPRLDAYEQPERTSHQRITTNISMLDEMLGGGLETGATCLIVGPSGVGKSAIASEYAAQSASIGAPASIYSFDEPPEAYLRRADGLGVALREHVQAGTVKLRQLDPGQIAPGEFAQDVRVDVEQRNTKVIVIDSIVGYFAAMGSADVLVTQLHELMTYLTRNDVLMIMCGCQEGFMSIGSQSAVDVSYLSDTILALRFFEAAGVLRRAAVVVKKKHGEHLLTIHELSLANRRIQISPEPLREPSNLFVPSRLTDATSG